MVVRGHVQGVGYRAFVAQVADRLGLVGTVGNTHDGTVEAALQGDRAALDAALDALRTGPPGARVDGLDVRDLEPVEGERRLTVR